MESSQIEVKTLFGSVRIEHSELMVLKPCEYKVFKKKTGFLRWKKYVAHINDKGVLTVQEL